ncbi:MAG TPA: IS21-like element helper ATPase IstB [Acidimicrobiales bacterium]|nr:IS21-like element helper ATPase IstB [Acidimicrobiales bacterium]
MDLQTTLESNLKRLRLPGMAENLDGRVREAEVGRLGYVDFLSLLLQDEIANRDANNFEKRLRDAGFSNDCTFEGFDYSFNADVLVPATIRDLATCRFIERKANLILGGPPGIGKSHLAQAIGHEACRRGLDVLFSKTHKLLDVIRDEQRPRKAQIVLKRAITVGLLVLDDFAFRRYTQTEAELLYTIADERLNRRSIIVTSNRPPEDWFSVFPDPVIGGAILDRLVSGALKLIIPKGRSYRKEHVSGPRKTQPKS